MISSEFQKVGILGSRIPDIILEKSGHFWLRPEIGHICSYFTYFVVENETKFDEGIIQNILIIVNCLPENNFCNFLSIILDYCMANYVFKYLVYQLTPSMSPRTKVQCGQNVYTKVTFDTNIHTTTF